MYRTMSLIVAGALLASSRARAGYVYTPTDFATQVISYSGPVDPRPAYNQPTAILDRPALSFNNSTINPNIQDIHRAKIIEAPFNYSAGTVATRKPVVTVLPATASVVVKMGRAVTDDRTHPYGDDLIVYGNSFFSGDGGGGFPDDSTNLNSFTLSGDVLAHPVNVAVSPDNAHWFTFPTLSNGMQPYNAYKWNRTSASWTNELLDPTLPLNPSIYSMSVAGKSTADVLNSYGNSAGGTALDLQDARDSLGRTLAQNHFTSISYVRFSSTADDYTVIAGVARVRGRFDPIPSPLFDPVNTLVYARDVPEPTRALLLFISLSLYAGRGLGRGSFRRNIIYGET